MSCLQSLSYLARDLTPSRAKNRPRPNTLIFEFVRRLHNHLTAIP